MSEFAILKNKKVVILKDSKANPAVLKWGRWFEDIKNRRVAKTTLSNGFEVSTVFLGLDHSFAPFPNQPHKHLWFETMVFAPHGGGEQYMERYETYEEAEWGHQAIVQKFKRNLFKAELRWQLTLIRDIDWMPGFMVRFIDWLRYGILEIK